MIIAFTGHRPDALGGYSADNPVKVRVKAAIRTALTQLRSAHGDDLRGISGMALGVDQWAAEVCIELKVPFTAAIPHDNQDERWLWGARAAYRELLTRAMAAIVVSPGPYAGYKLLKRNVWMVDQCDALLAVLQGTTGGTAKTVAYAESQGKPVTRLTW